MLTNSVYAVPVYNTDGPETDRAECGDCQKQYPYLSNMQKMW